MYNTLALVDFTDEDRRTWRHAVRSVLVGFVRELRTYLRRQP